jgi:hypothetical protein
VLGVGVVVGKQPIDQHAAFIRVRIRDKRAEIVRRRQQPPDVEERPPRERGIADEFPGWTARASQISGSESIDRRRPAGPDDIGERRTLERSGASHFGAAAAEAGVARAPSSIHRRIVATSPADSAGFPSGIDGGTWPVMRSIRRLPAALPGRMAAPLRPPSSASTYEASDSPPDRRSAL